MGSEIMTLIVASVIGVAFLAVIIKAVVDKKRGRHSCSCGSSCGACPMADKCHSDTK